MAPASRQEQFINALLPYARQMEQRTGIPAAWTLAMAANETGWNASNPVLFGIKGTSPSGKSGTFRTWEDYGQGRVDISDRFATYNDPSEAFAHLAQEMGTARYQNAPRTSAQEFATYLQRQGWATDPQYAAKISRLAAEIGAAGGGQTMEPQETGGSGKPTTGRAGADELDATLGPIRERLGRLQAEYEKLQKEYEEQAYPAYQAAMEEYSVTLNPAVKEVAERRLNDIKTRLAQIAKEAEAERTREQRTQELISRFLTQRNQEIQDKLATGTQELNWAKHEWEKTMDQANLAQQGKISALSLFKDAIPQMGNEETARAAEQALAGWGSLLPGGKAPSFRPPVVPFDPLAVTGYGSGGAPQQAPPFTPPPAAPQMSPAAASAIAQGDPQAAEAERIAQQMRADQERRMRENLAMGQAAPSEPGELPTMPVGYPDVPGYQPDDPEWASMSTYAPPPPVDMAAPGPYGRMPSPAPAPTPVPWQSQPTPTPVPLAAQGTPTPFAEPTPLATPFAGPVPWWEYIARGQTPGR